jgi:hypothetical protein
MSSLRPYATQMAGKQRPDLKSPNSVTSTQAKSAINSATGVDVDAAAKNVDTDRDGRFTTSELASAESKNLSKLAEKLDTDGDSKVTKAEVTAKLDQANKERDSDGNDKVGKAENGAYAAKVAEQLDSQYTGMRLKGFSREDVSSQLSSVDAVGRSSSVIYGDGAYAYSKADKDGDGRVNTTEGEDYVANKTGLSDDVKQVKAREKSERAEKAEQDEKTEKTDDTATSDKTARAGQEKETDTAYTPSDATVARQLLMVQAYSATNAHENSGRLTVSA